MEYVILISFGICAVTLFLHFIAATMIRWRFGGQFSFTAIKHSFQDTTKLAAESIDESKGTLWFIAAVVWLIYYAFEHMPL